MRLASNVGHVHPSQRHRHPSFAAVRRGATRRLRALHVRHIKGRLGRLATVEDEQERDRTRRALVVHPEGFHTEGAVLRRRVPGRGRGSKVMGHWARPGDGAMS